MHPQYNYTTNQAMGSRGTHGQQYHQYDGVPNPKYGVAGSYGNSISGGQGQFQKWPGEPNSHAAPQQTGQSQQNGHNFGTANVTGASAGSGSSGGATVQQRYNLDQLRNLNMLGHVFCNGGGDGRATLRDDQMPINQSRSDGMHQRRVLVQPSNSSYADGTADKSEDSVPLWRRKNFGQAQNNSQPQGPPIVNDGASGNDHRESMRPPKVGGPEQRIPPNVSGGPQQRMPPDVDGAEQRMPPYFGREQRMPTNVGDAEQRMPADVGDPQHWMPPKAGGSQLRIPPGFSGHDQRMPPKAGGPQQRIPPGFSGLDQRMPPKAGGPQQRIPPGFSGHDQWMPPDVGGQQQPPNVGGQQQPPNVGGQQQPPNVGDAEQRMPPNVGGPHQQIPPGFSGHDQRIPPNFDGPQQRMPPDGDGSEHRIPPTVGDHQQRMPPNFGGAQQRMPPKASGPEQRFAPDVGGPQQRMPPDANGPDHRIPPTFGDHQQRMPPNFSGLQQHMPTNFSGPQQHMPPYYVGPHHPMPSNFIGAQQRMPPNADGFHHFMPQAQGQMRHEVYQESNYRLGVVHHYCPPQHMPRNMGEHNEAMFDRLNYGRDRNQEHSLATAFQMLYRKKCPMEVLVELTQQLTGYSVNRMADPHSNFKKIIMEMSGGDRGPIRDPNISILIKSVKSLHELGHLIQMGSKIAAKIATTHNKSPCFKNMDTLCTRLNLDLVRPNTVLANVNSQGAAWAIKDLIFVYTRISTGWITLRNYIYNLEPGMANIKKSFSSKFLQSFVDWQDQTQVFLQNVSDTFVHLNDVMEAQRTPSTPDAPKQKPDEKVDENPSGSASTENSAPTFVDDSIAELAELLPKYDLSLAIVNNSEDRQVEAIRNGTRLSAGSYTPIGEERISANFPNGIPPDTKTYTNDTNDAADTNVSDINTYTNDTNDAADTNVSDINTYTNDTNDTNDAADTNVSDTNTYTNDTNDAADPKAALPDFSIPPPGYVAMGFVSQTRTSNIHTSNVHSDMVAEHSDMQCSPLQCGMPTLAPDFGINSGLAQSGFVGGMPYHIPPPPMAGVMPAVVPPPGMNGFVTETTTTTSHFGYQSTFQEQSNNCGTTKMNYLKFGLRNFEKLLNSVNFHAFFQQHGMADIDLDSAIAANAVLTEFFAVCGVMPKILPTDDLLSNITDKYIQHTEGGGFTINVLQQQPKAAITLTPKPLELTLTQEKQNLTKKLNAIVNSLLTMTSAELFFKKTITKNYFPKYILLFEEYFFDLNEISSKVQKNEYSNIVFMIHDIRKIIHFGRNYLKFGDDKKFKKAIDEFEEDFNKVLTSSPFENCNFDHIQGIPNELNSLLSGNA